MQVKEFMTGNPVCCEPETRPEEGARMMIDNDCGEIPIVENPATYLIVLVITDRDIVCRRRGIWGTSDLWGRVLTYKE